MSMTEKSNSLIESPCVRNCCLNFDDICLGCFRHIDEITGWSQFSNDIRVEVLEVADSRKQDYNKSMNTLIANADNGEEMPDH